MDTGIELLTKKELADAFRVTPRTIDRMMEQGKIPFIKLPGGYSVRFKLQDVKQVLNSTSTNTAAA
jgi:excisionase family DNA binding protein